MTRTYMIKAAVVASLALATLTPAVAAVPGGKPVSQAKAAPAPAPLDPAQMSASEKAGCGAVLVMLGKVATHFPQAFASKGSDGRGAQFMLEAFGAKGRMMMDEAFEDGAAQGVKPTQVYEDGLVFLFDNVKPAPGETTETAGKRAAVALMQRCTGIKAD